MIKIVLILIIIYMLYNYNIKNNVINKSAIIGEFSNDNNYSNITPLKHDIFKQWTIDSIPIVASLLLSNNKYLDTSYGKYALSAVGYIIYYHIAQPYVVNRLPNF